MFIALGNLAAVSFVRYYMAFKTAMLGTIKTPIVVGIVVLVNVCGYLMSTLQFATDMTLFVSGCLGISNGNNSEKWLFWLYFLYVLILLSFGVWYDIAYYYLLKNWNQIQLRVNPEQAVQPWNDLGDEEVHDYTIPAGSSTLTITIAFAIISITGYMAHVTNPYALIMVYSYNMLSIILIATVGFALLASAWSQFPNLPQSQDEPNPDRDHGHNSDDRLNQPQAAAVGGEEPQQKETNDSTEEQGEREVEENNSKEEILAKQVPSHNVIPKIQDQEQNVDNGLDQSQAAAVGEDPQLTEINENLEVQIQGEAEENHMIEEIMEEQAQDLRIIQYQSRRKITCLMTKCD